jgi:hypothetical protein
MEHYQKAVKADPNSAVMHYNVALTLDKMSKRADATASFKKAKNTWACKEKRLHSRRDRAVTARRRITASMKIPFTGGACAELFV